jgi:peroxiredoxin
MLKKIALSFISLTVLGACNMQEVSVDKSLQEALEAQRTSLNAQISPEKLAIIEKASQDLANSGIHTNFLRVGDRAPDWELKDSEGEEYSLDDELDQGPVILSFYRGGWCPYCNLQLRALQEYLPQYEDLGANLIAISPELPSKTEQSKTLNKLDYRVLSDLGNQVARAYGLVFSLPEELRTVYADLGIDLPAYNGDETFELPVPGTFLVDEKGIIRYAFLDTDYTKRAEPSEILKELKKIAK